MCGRYTLTAEPDVIQKTFNLDTVPPLQARFNIAPSQAVPIITSDQPKQLSFVRWGLIPSWAKDESISNKLINARSETLDEKPSFKNAFKRRRCLIPADGFYEWYKGENGKQPHYIFLQGRPVFAFAGLWEVWQSPHGDSVETCTIITTTPNDLIKPLHHRMAVILSPDHYDLWLDHNVETDMLKPLLQAYSSDEMQLYEVAPGVNNVYNDGPELIKPFTSPKQTSLF